MAVQHEVQRTTPEAIDLQRTFREMLDGGDRACAMEVSSHALELHRADAIHFAAAIFTNLTQDHLDFHPTMEAYFDAKRALFVGDPPGCAIVNVDDEYGARLAAELDDPTTYALRAGADYRATELTTDITGSSFTVRTPDGELRLTSPLRGEFNVYNVLGALAAARALGVPESTCAAAIATAGQVPGRFETVDAGQPFAVAGRLRAHAGLARERAHGRPRADRGAADRGVRLRRRSRPRQAAADGRDREPARRPGDRHLGQPALRGSRGDRATRSWPAPGPGPSTRSIVSAAIARAIAAADRGDVVVIAGKGHEQGQEFEDGRKLPFDDVTVAREILGGHAGRRRRHPAMKQTGQPSRSLRRPAQA